MAGKRKGLGADHREAIARSAPLRTIEQIDRHVVSSVSPAARKSVPRDTIDWALSLIELAFEHGSPEEAHAAVDRAFEWLGKPDKVTRDSPLANVPGVSVRIANMLEAASIHTVSHYLDCSEARLLLIENFGHKGREELARVLKEAGFTRAEAVTV